MVWHQVTERGIAIVADGLVQRHRGGEAVQFGIFSSQAFSIARTLTQCCAQVCRTITGDTNEAGLLVKCATDGLANPECGVSGEFETTAPVKLVDGVLEPEVAFLNEVQEVHALWQWIATSNRHHEAQVGANETIFGTLGVAQIFTHGSSALTLF